MPLFLNVLCNFFTAMWYTRGQILKCTKFWLFSPILTNIYSAEEAPAL